MHRSWPWYPLFGYSGQARPGKISLDYAMANTTAIGAICSMERDTVGLNHSKGIATMS